MRRAAVWVLSVAGVIGLLLAFGFEGWRGPNGPEFRMGFPDSWVVWESLPNGGHHFEVNLLRWSVLILVGSVYALYYAVRLSRRRSPDAEPDAAPDRAGITAFRGTLARHPARQVSRVVRRRRATASVPRDQIADGSLPSVCVVCGADAPHRRFPGVGAPSLAWVLFSPLIGLVTFWAYILFAGGSSGGGLPFCDRHRGYWPRRAWFIVVGFAAVVGLMVVAASLTPPAAPGKKDEPHWLFGVAGCWMLVFLPAFLVLHLSATRPTGGNRKSLVLSGASRDFVAALDVGRGHAEPGAAPDRGRM